MKPETPHTENIPSAIELSAAEIIIEMLSKILPHDDLVCLNYEYFYGIYFHVDMRKNPMLACRIIARGSNRSLYIEIPDNRSAYKHNRHRECFTNPSDLYRCENQILDYVSYRRSENKSVK